MEDRVDHLRIGLTYAHNQLADHVADQITELSNRVAYFERQLHMLTLRTDMLDRARLEQGSDVRAAGEGIEDLDKRLEAHRDSAATHIARISRAVESLEFNAKHGAGPGAEPPARKHSHHRHKTRVVFALEPHLAVRLEACVKSSGDRELLRVLWEQMHPAPAP